MDAQEARPGGVVVGVDGSVPSRAALEFAYRDAARRGVPLRVVAAYSPPEYTQIWLETSVGTDLAEHGETTEKVRVAAQAMVDDVRAGLAGEPAPPSVAVEAVAGLPARTLVAESAGAELLVVGSRGHGGFASMMLGSVSLQTVLHARCPVTVVHAPRPAAAQEEQAEQAEDAGFDPMLAAPLL
ncbi:universal stress protein [Pseudonocardia sp.]|uniref:universal stress protein n=1 Tax=Pseudonocardia sp. TaxID=60912 RepID=UPI003D0FBB40